MVRLFVAQKFVAQKKEERLNPEWIQPWVLKGEILNLLPLEENELRTEGRTHGGEDAVGAGFAWGVDEDVFEYGEDGGGG